jgi:hypothetical protein
MASDSSDSIQRWTVKRRAALVISIWRGETTAAEAARNLGLTVGEIDHWRERFQQRAENALRARNDTATCGDPHVVTRWLGAASDWPTAERCSPGLLSDTVTAVRKSGLADTRLLRRLMGEG